ncbi:MAG: ornithine cyclodeaminase family protein [Proteobacteria bacterium]|nr:ornithine cyclodeaminase family protein [Pseudomonadota bacterium]
MALLIDSRDLAGLISIEDAVAAVRQGFTDQGNTPSYSALRVRMQHEDRRLTVHPGGCPSLKIAGMFIHAERFTFEGNAQQYNGAGRRVYVAYDSETAEHKAIIVGSLPLFAFDSFEESFATETPITSAVGTDMLARPDCKILALYGTGLQARRHLIAMCAIRPIEEVRVYSRSAENRADFVAFMQGQVDIPVRAVDDPQEAAAGADLICMATNTNIPALFGDWLEPGQHITSIVNSNKGVKEQAKLAHARRELDDEVIRRSDIILVNVREQSIVDEHGDLFEPIEAGITSWDRIIEMGDILTGRAEGRTSPDQITLFKQNSDQGVGYMALAGLVCDIAERNKIGIEI